MTASPVRAAGRGRDGAGRLVLWSVAEGAGGRRWREATLDDASPNLARSLTLETGPDRAPTRLEAATGLGLLTLHPEPHGVFGNFVGSRGVRPISLEGAAPRFLVAGSGLVAAALCWSAEPRLAPGDRMDLDVVRLQLLDPGGGSEFLAGLDVVSVQRIDGGQWRLVSVDREPLDVQIDGDGLPIASPGRRWPLEAEVG